MTKEGTTTKNYIKIGNNKYNFITAKLLYLDLDFHAPEDHYVLSLYLPGSQSSGIIFFFDIVSSRKTSLDEGEYTYFYDPEESSFTTYPIKSFANIYFNIIGDNYKHNVIQEGTLSVKKKNTVYEITIDGKTDSGIPVTLYYKGLL